jgi:lipid-binding SYLF domain-containing protein
VLAVSTVFGQKKTDDEKRAIIKEARTEILQTLYKVHPEAKSKIQSAVGYGTFDNRNMNLFLLSTGNGKGMVTDNRSGKSTYMAMGSVGGGVGIGAKDLSVVFIFNDAATMEKFVKEGWQFGGQADATAKVKDEGGAAAVDGTIDTSAQPLIVYTITDTGIALQATVAGTKYWQLKKLN